MSSYLERYKSRVNQSDKLITNTKSSNSKTFESQPFYTLVEIDGIQKGAIVVQNNKSEEKKLLLQPDTKVDIGAVVKINILNYLTMDFLGEGINGIYPTATLKLCNSTFPIVTNKRTVLLGTDKLCRPVTEQVSDIKQEPCIVETRYYFNNRNEQVTLPEDRIMVTLKYQESESVAINQIFDMYNSQFKITFVDYTKTVNGKGTMTITGERMVKK